jgi:hypothetical protein
MGKLTVSMAMFNSKLLVYQAGYIENDITGGECHHSLSYPTAHAVRGSRLCYVLNAHQGVHLARQLWTIERTAQQFLRESLDTGYIMGIQREDDGTMVI